VGFVLRQMASSSRMHTHTISSLLLPFEVQHQGDACCFP
jgi:hypothetical protein